MRLIRLIHRCCLKSESLCLSEQSLTHRAKGKLNFIGTKLSIMDWREKEKQVFLDKVDALQQVLSMEQAEAQFLKEKVAAAEEETIHADGKS